MRQLYDSAGQVVANRRYEPFGSLLSASGTGESIYGFAGEQLDASTGLVYLRARYLDTGVGRFTQVDPSAWEANPYLYAGANPATYVDPRGLFPPGIPPSPTDREAWETWMRDVALPWLYGVYTSHRWDEHLGVDFPTVARAYERGEAAARQNPIDRPNIVAQAIMEEVPISDIGWKGLYTLSVREQLHEKNLLLSAMVDDYALKLSQWIDAFTWAGVLRYMPLCCGPARVAEEEFEPFNFGPPTEPSRTLRPLVVGGNVDRVRAVAEAHGYLAWTPREPLDDPLDVMRRDTRMMQDAMREGRVIIDIGPDPQLGKAGWFYAAEDQAMTSANYPWRFRVYGPDGVPGLDYPVSGE